jgi:hypothetical protein
MGLGYPGTPERYICNAEYDEWWAWLEYKYNIDGAQQGNIQEEQLLIEKQQMYTCPKCQHTSLLL